MRFSDTIRDELGLPVVAEVERITTFSESHNESINMIKIGFGVAVILVIYAIVGWLKFTGGLS